MWGPAGDFEPRRDLRAARRDEGSQGQLLAIGRHLEGPQFCTGGAGVIRDSALVQEDWQGDAVVIGGHVREPWLVSELLAAIAARVEEEDLRRFIIGGLLGVAEVDERDRPAVGADGPPEGKKLRRAAGRSEPTELAPTGAHDEDALLRYIGREGGHVRELLRQVEDRRAVLQHPHVLDNSHRVARVDIVEAPAEALHTIEEAGVVERGGHGARWPERRDGDRVAIPMADKERLLERTALLRVGGALSHHVGERPDARARGGAVAPLGAGRPAISAPLAAAGTRLLARLQLLRAGALARCRGASSRGCER